MNDPVRGEVTVDLGGERHMLVPSWAAFRAIETQLGLGVFETWERIRSGSMQAIVTVLWAGITQGGKDKKPTPADIAKFVLEQGIQSYSVPAGQFLEVAARGLSNLNDDEDEPADAGDEKSAGDGSLD